MWLLARRPRAPKSSVNAPGAAGFSLVTTENGRSGPDWADAAAASPTRAAQIVKRPVRGVERFVPFVLMVMDPALVCFLGDGFGPCTRLRAALDAATTQPNLPVHIGSGRRWGASLERTGRNGTRL